ncbi:heptaprenyl diphosphate synthase component 1 [Bacillus sp. PS06]|uniref:heptaprenyl diphosphate synthase component 1 n=1 Tax=Bacillus sp. PS06 TaxID=2764176 RepID=UPI00177DC3AC|nr:heptaprenyl diphosphate synthase component 1 [Bacillus sp. PS06]MBD8070256.1 heptaprenyl diphosphate synthase component 1 [Bacillus sp. PS06]
MLDINVRIANFKKRIEGELNHSYLHKYLSNPIIDEDKLLLLYTIFEEIEIEEHELEHYVLTTMLIQLALDTHDQVSTNTSLKPSSQLKNQLTVLAGDYFSGLYYYFLAQAGDLKMIQLLSEATKEVNEHKIRVYQSDITQVETLLESIEIIESSLIKKVIQFFQLPNWELFISKFLLLRRLINERELYLLEGHSIVVDAFCNISYPHSNKRNEHSELKSETILEKLDIQIKGVKDILLSLGSNNFIGNHLLEERMNQLVNYHSQLPMNKIAEEGS